MIDRIIEFLLNNPYLTLFGATCLVQIAPIKINPWSKLLNWIGFQINKDLHEEVTKLDAKICEVENRVGTLNNDVSEDRVQRKRWHILDFTNTCRQGRLHTKEEWDHCLDELEWYETYCENNGIPNGVITESAKWLRARYSEHMENDDFLKD